MSEQTETLWPIFLSLAEHTPRLFAQETLDGVYQAAGEILSEKMGYGVAIFEVGRYHMRLKYVSISERLKKLAQKTTGLDAGNFSISSEDFVVMEQIQKTREPVFLKDTRDITRDALDNIYKQRPGAQKYLVKGLSGIMNFIAQNIFPFLNKKIVSAPVIARGEIVAVMHLFGDNLAEEHIPLIRHFAQLTGAAMQARMEQAARDDGGRFDAILQNSPLFVIETDLQGNIIYTNVVAAKLFAAGESMLGKSILEFIPDQNRELEQLIFAHGLEGDAQEGIVTPVRRSDGQECVVLINSAPRMTHGNIAGLNIFGLDVTRLGLARQVSNAGS